MLKLFIGDKVIQLYTKCMEIVVSPSVLSPNFVTSWEVAFGSSKLVFLYSYILHFGISTLE